MTSAARLNPSTPRVCFTETLRGHLQPQGVEQPAGPSHELALVDLSIELECQPRTASGGLSGRIHRGFVHVPQLQAEPLPLSDGTVEILSRNAPCERIMRYDMQGRTDRDGTVWRLTGVKPVNNRSPHGWPGRIWHETSTLYVDLEFQSPPPGWPNKVRGVVRLQPTGLLRLLASLRVPAATGWFGAARTLVGFVDYFARRLWPVYLPGGGD